MQIAHKIELKPNNKQKTYFRKSCGIARFSWNWALAEWNNQYRKNKTLTEEGKIRISGMSLKKQ
jgi:putative transposase